MAHAFGLLWIVAASMRVLTFSRYKALHSKRDRTTLFVLTEKGRELRRCTANTRFGVQCRAYSVAGLEVCISHSAWRSRGPGSERPPLRLHRWACRCEAYQWPHRRGSGVCRWPDPPRTPCATPSGTRRRRDRKILEKTRLKDLHQSSHPPKALPKVPVPTQPRIYCVSRVVAYRRVI